MSNVKRYIPRREKRWHRNPDGSVSAVIYGQYGVVEVFTFPGDERHRAFTSLEMFLYPYVYHQTIERHYHERWLRRIAYAFEHECFSQSASEVNDVQDR